MDEAPVTGLRRIPGWKRLDMTLCDNRPQGIVVACAYEHLPLRSEEKRTEGSGEARMGCGAISGL